jgi:hypothetical protein
MFLGSSGMEVRNIPCFRENQTQNDVVGNTYGVAPHTEYHVAHNSSYKLKVYDNSFNESVTIGILEENNITSITHTTFTITNETLTKEIKLTFQHVQSMPGLAANESVSHGNENVYVTLTLDETCHVDYEHHMVADDHDHGDEDDDDSGLAIGLGVGGAALVLIIGGFIWGRSNRSKLIHRFTKVLTDEPEPVQGSKF